MGYSKGIRTLISCGGWLCEIYHSCHDYIYTQKHHYYSGTDTHDIMDNSESPNCPSIQGHLATKCWSPMVSVIEGFHCNMIMQPKIIELLTHQVFNFHRLQLREYLTPLQATDPGGTITMVTTSGRSFTRQIRTDNTAVQETNQATPGQLVLGNWSVPVEHKHFSVVTHCHCHCFMMQLIIVLITVSLVHHWSVK